MDAFELTRRLMAIPSVSGSESAVGEFLATHLSGRGYQVERLPVTGDRFNLLAVAGEPEIVFCTHIDTVPSVLPIREDDGHLYGRGACDAKGILAAMLHAGDRLRNAGITRFAYLLLVGEEVDGIGARAANERSWNNRYVIVGEPTQNHLAKAQKGTLLANLTVHGRAAHSGYPEAGVSAIHGLLEVLRDCLQCDWGKDPDLGHGTLNVGVLEGGEKANIIAARARASVMIRTVEPRKAVEQRLRDCVMGRAAVEVLVGTSPQFMHVVEGFPTTVVSFGSDVPYLTKLGRPLLVGPGSILDAHTDAEKISKNELMAGAELYYTLARRLLS